MQVNGKVIKPYRRRPMEKLVSLPNCVDIVGDGDMVALGGKTLYRRPFAFCKELAKSHIKNLTLLSLTCGIESDLLLSSGCVGTVRTCYFGFDFFGLAPNFRRMAESGMIKIIEETELTISLGLKAALMGESFLPTSALLETDYPKVRKDLKIVEVDGKKFCCVPALAPDIAVIHVPFCDRYGNAHISSTLACDRELSRAAKKTILTAERIVSTKKIKELGCTLIAPEVHAVVKCSGGASPTSCYPFYTFDARTIIKYMEASHAT